MYFEKKKQFNYFRKKLHLRCLRGFPTPLGLNTESVTDRGSTKLMFYNVCQNSRKYLRKSPFYGKVTCCRSTTLLKIHSITDIFKDFDYNCRTALVRKRFCLSTILECFCKQY